MQRQMDKHDIEARSNGRLREGYHHTMKNW